MFDMIVDRCCTITLLIILAFRYPQYKAYFISMALLDFVSHWYQMYSSILEGADTHRAGLAQENWVIRFYYKFPGALLMCCVGAEAFSLLVYWASFQPYLLEELYFKIPLYAAIVIFHFKQVFHNQKIINTLQFISVLQLLSSTNRILNYDIELIELRNRKANK
jgi:hypothetical protein